MFLTSKKQNLPTVKCHQEQRAQALKQQPSYSCIYAKQAYKISYQAYESIKQQRFHPQLLPIKTSVPE